MLGNFIKYLHTICLHFHIIFIYWLCLFKTFIIQQKIWSRKMNGKMLHRKIIEFPSSNIWKSIWEDCRKCAIDFSTNIFPCFSYLQLYEKILLFYDIKFKMCSDSHISWLYLGQSLQVTLIIFYYKNFGWIRWKL